MQIRFKRVASVALAVSLAVGAASTMAQVMVGGALTAKTANGKVMIVDENGNAATVTIADVMQSNGVIHVVDKVLLPK